MKIKGLFLIIFSGIICIAVAMVALVYFMLVNQNNLERSETNRYESYLRADELRQSSDDLTGLARTYVATGDDKYEKMYWDVLAIRNGELPRPLNYEKIYWDYMAYNGEKPRPDGEKIPLQTLFEQLGFSGIEFAKLKESQKNSDSLVWIETIAMNAMKGLFDDGTGHFRKQGKPDYEMARRLMFSNEYHKEKVRIMKPIDEFFTLLDSRTKSAVQTYRTQGNAYFIILLVLLVILVLASLFGYTVIRQKIVKKLGADPSEIEQITRKVAQGELDFDMAASDKQATGVLASVRKMVESLGKMAKEAILISKGDLTVEIHPVSEKDSMGNAFKMMVDRLRNQMDEIRQAVNVLASSSNEILVSVTQLAASSAESAASIGETTVAVEEVKQTAEMVSHKAKEVSANAGRMSRISNEGSKAIANTLEGMNRIKKQMGYIAGMVIRLSEQSQTIGEITATVNELADQSNLLAVNAAMEAAKAGEHGKGFSIVAREIKNLAERSKEATLQVRNILRDIQKAISAAVLATEEGGKAVEEGLKLTALSGETITILSKSIEEAAGNAIQITSSSAQQLEGMDQVVTAMENIKEASAQSAAGTQQSVESVNELQKVGQKLDELMKQYKLESRK